jgi:general secretion pathway protein E
MAQRLVRRLCPECSEEYAPSEAELSALRIDPRYHAAKRLRRARGCRACEGTGYRGRTGLFEVLELDDALRDLTFRGASLEELKKRALAAHRLRPLLADGARKVLAGATSATEVLRVTRADEP